jgi:NADPH-dependent glutamate synthase beta subunit-like oxidoreductase/NAD-dependent dihydropyrimidine dehydrogenase PreA subunit
MLERLRDKRVDRDWLNTNFPCMMACPAGTNAGKYVALIAEGRFEEAYRYARDPNPLASICGRVCAHPCETNCRRGAIDHPIAIRALKRFLTERYGPESRHPLEAKRCTVPKLGYKVAIIGSGPVGLSAAHDLALMGYSVTIFEATQVAGGMLHLGIPEYRLPRSVVEAQVREILDAGDVTLKLNAAAGREFTIAALSEWGFDAVVIAVGAHRSRDLAIPGADLDGVLKGTDFLLNMNLGYQFTIGRKVVVIGGGNVAMDVARSAVREVLRQHGGGPVHADRSSTHAAALATREAVDISLSALRLGARDVSIVYRRRRDQMRAAAEEIEEMQIEGVHLYEGRTPTRVLGRNGKVVGLETVASSGPHSAEPHHQSVIECDTVILAIGQEPRLDFLTPEDGIDVSIRGLIVADHRTLMTSAPGVFAGGDCVFGPRLIIDSVGDGKRIALGVDEYLTGRAHPEPEIEVEILSHHKMIPGYMEIARQQVPTLPLDRRTGITEVELVFDEKTAMREAQRCLHCWINTVFEGNEPDGSQCTLCGGCVDVCPESCIQLVSLDRIEFPPEVLAQMQSDGGVFKVELDDIAASELGTITGSAMLKDETRCIRCGLCAERCPVDVITMEAYSLKMRAPEPVAANGESYVV